MVLVMNTGRGEAGSSERVTRRSVLAAGGALSVAGLAGCTDAIDGLIGEAAAGTVTNKYATPAAFYGGDSPTDGSRAASDYTVEHVPIRISGEYEGLDSSVDLSGYVTTSLLRAQNHNSSRSNRTDAIRVDSDDDGDGLADVLELERQLSTQVAAASDSISKRSARNTRPELGDVDDTITAIQAELEHCTSDVCATVRDNADARKESTQAAIDAVDAGDWAQAETSISRVEDLVAGDIDRLEAALDADSDADGLDDGSELAAYLDGEATIGERFVFSVPDARLGEDGDSLLGELTPEVVLEYLSGGDGPKSDSVMLRKRPGLAADIEWPFPTGTGPYNPNEQLLALGYRGRFSNLSTSLDPSVRGEIDDDGDGDETIDEGVFISNGTVSRANGGGLYAWGSNRVQGESDASGTVVLAVAAQPEDCPEPMPALLYVRRVRHDDQHVFAGGWILDDSALYHNAVTMLVAEGAPELSSVAHDRGVEEMRRSITSGLSRDRSRLGSQTYDGELSEKTLSFLPPHHREGAGREELLLQAHEIVGGRNSRTGKEIKIALRDGSVGPDAESLQTTVVPIDNPIVHISLGDGCEDCEECSCTTNLVPAVNTISSR